MSNKKVRNLWPNMSKQQRQQYLINNVKSIMGRVKNHDIQGVRMDYGIDNVNAFLPNLKNIHQSPSNLVKDSLFEEDRPFNCDNNALRCIYHRDGSETLRAINRADVLGFGEKVIEYLKHPNKIGAKALAN